MRWAGHVAPVEERYIQGFDGNSEGRRPPGRPRHRWEDNIKMDLQEVGCGDMDWIHVAQYSDTCDCGNNPSGSIKCGEFVD